MGAGAYPWKKKSRRQLRVRSTATFPRFTMSCAHMPIGSNSKRIAAVWTWRSFFFDFSIEQTKVICNDAAADSVHQKAGGGGQILERWERQFPGGEIVKICEDA
jgi:hypothetical protein